jgi:phosphate transport system substrate-binding protein
MKTVFAFCFMFLSLFIQAQSVKIKGSDTMLPLVQAVAEIFMDQNKSILVSVTGGGSGTGITALRDGSTDAAMASRSLKMSEKIELTNSKKEFVEVEIAYDALSIIIHKSNPVEKLTREQLEGIFTGEITNWKQVGGQDLAIVAFTRESSSGTYEFMKEHVMSKKEFAKTAISSASNAAIVQSVSQTKGGIGYIGLAYIEDVIKPISVSFDNGPFVKPTFKNALDKIYPISRPLYIYYLKTNEAKVKRFLDFFLSPLGQKLVTHKGYIPIVIKK